MLFQIFYNNSNTELQVMLLKLQSKYSPIPLVFRNIRAQVEAYDSFNLNVNAFYVFLESYPIINFSLSHKNSQIGKTDLINKIFYQVDKFEIRDTCVLNNKTIDLMFDYSFSATRNLAIADCNNIIPLTILDKLLPLFKLWIIQINGEKEIDEMLDQLLQLNTFKQYQQKQIVVLIRNSTKSNNFQNKFEKLEKLQITFLQVKDLTNSKLSKQDQEQEIAKIGNQLFSIIGQNYQKQLVNQKDFIQIVKNFNDSQRLNKEFQQNIEIINQLEIELNNLVSSEDAFDSPNAFPRHLESKIIQFKEQYQRFSTEQQKEREKLEEMIKTHEKQLTQLQATTLLDLFCQIFSQQNYYILYLWFVDTIRSFNKLHTSKLSEEIQNMNAKIKEDRFKLKQFKQVKDNPDTQKIEDLHISIRDNTEKVNINQAYLSKRQISIELFWREIIFQSKHRPLTHNMNPAQIVHEMISKGEPFEFLDGDQLKIDQQFLEELIKQFKNQGKEQILVFSVLGPQSSGKSTILNKIFGCHFWTSVGRSTKGIQFKQN